MKKEQVEFCLSQLTFQDDGNLVAVSEIWFLVDSGLFSGKIIKPNYDLNLIHLINDNKNFFIKMNSIDMITDNNIADNFSGPIDEEDLEEEKLENGY